MSANEFNARGIKLTIVEKPEHEMIGFKKSANEGDGSLDLFVSQLIKSGKTTQLAQATQPSQEVWLCLSDCLSCGLNCTGVDFCSIVCVEKTENSDFSAFEDNELFTFRLPASKWVRYELNDVQSWDNLFEFGIYDLVQEVGYKWNNTIRLHFDNQTWCHNDGKWNEGKVGYFLLPVVSM
jgi:hypothetical protein